MDGCIYVLIDPRDSEVRYVGKTKSGLERRLRGHVRIRRREASSPRARWITKLLRLGYTPRIEAVQWLPYASCDDAERYWIGYYRGLGCRLTNVTDGGPGGVTTAGRPLSEEHRRKIADANRGKSRPSPRRGAQLSIETRAKISASHVRRRALGLYTHGYRGQTRKDA